MQPTGILINSKPSKTSKQRKSVTWGMLYAIGENREQSVSSIPLTSFKEQEQLNRMAERDYFGLVDLSGLETSRRRAATVLNETTLSTLPVCSTEDSTVEFRQDIVVGDSEDFVPRRKRNESKSFSEIDSESQGGDSEPSSPTRSELPTLELASSRRRGSFRCKWQL